jgi:hypothetical protein
MSRSHDSPRLPDDHDKNAPRDRIDADPPYGSSFPEKVKRFRGLLAELIARQILAERQAPKDFDNKTDS